VLDLFILGIFHVCLYDVSGVGFSPIFSRFIVILTLIYIINGFRTPRPVFNGPGFNTSRY
jgi:hypothetical protein